MLATRVIMENGLKIGSIRGLHTQARGQGLRVAYEGGVGLPIGHSPGFEHMGWLGEGWWGRMEWW
jgi:hypothetical protein